MEQKLNVLVLESGDYRTELPSNYGKRKQCWNDPSLITAAIPGTVMELKVKEGQSVSEGDVLFILDSMKMNNRICCSVSGVVDCIFVSEGQSVGKGEPMVKIKTI